MYYDGQDFTIIGKFHNEKNYVRFPQEYKNTLRKDVWDLGQHSAGISIRFRTNASVITVRWTIKGDEIMDHMAFTGIKGVDMYAYIDDHWKFVNTGRVKGKTNEFTNILSRAMDRSFINMGFSGSCTFDLPVGEAMCETDAALYVIDCNPNTQTELIYDRAIELVKLLKKKRPSVPVLLVEGFYYENGFGKPQDSDTEKKRIELRRAFKVLKESGIKKLYY
jgi:hypothetical protein